ncbi:hypothetical protein MLD38_020319 [Melastoma candidum]|uniref:Uncharacterized protein n=1 Tax=Melastoma candidum TaxID=119954 RepID=A0ACB9QFJ9_9MYRT|nr:hypothetical protein MLD38_020319 [Melastoma candidum]
MESLPVEVIGNILSQLKAARDVVIASATCRKWREACRYHLRALSFDSSDWPDLTTSRLEILITQTIFQTHGLQALSISMEDAEELSASLVIAWLMYTKDTLRELCYNVRTHPNINILERCGRQRLEVLSLAHTVITGVEPSYQKFPYLRSLSLSHVSLSALDLSLLLLICPRIESLGLINADIALSDTQATMELISASLKELHVEAISLDKLVVEADNLQKLRLRDCSLEMFEHIGKGGLRVFKMDDVSILHLDIGENTEDLEVVDVQHFTVMWPKFYNMISKSSKLRTLRLWGLTLADQMEGMDLETISACFPHVSHLALEFDLADSILDHCLQGSSRLENVLVLELGWSVLTNRFMVWVAGLLERCPNLKKLLICVSASEANLEEEYEMIADMHTAMIPLMRKHTQVDVQFKYE